MSDALQQFRDALLSVGLTPPDVIEPGVIHKFPGYQKGTANRAAWCFMFDDMRGGSYGDFSSGMEGNWQANNAKPYTDSERDNHRVRIEAIKVQNAAELAERHAAAAVSAGIQWDSATPCTTHAYLTMKGVKAHGLRVNSNGALLVPMIDTTGKKKSIQTITPDGDKRFLSGGKVTGCYHAIGKPTGPGAALIVCEGYATGASIHEATLQAVAVAFNAGNLEAVASALHTKYPALQIIIAADDDYQNAVNTGLIKATAVALATGALLAVPDFGVNRPDGAKDFNDLHQLSGAAAVKAGIDGAIKPIADNEGTAGTTGQIDDASPNKTPAWPDLQPLISKVEPQPYPLDALPPLVRCAVEEVQGFVKAPVPLIAASALASMSLAIQAHTDVERADKLHGPCSLFMLAIAESGERKSSCDGYFTKAIKDYEAEQREIGKPLIDAYKSDLEIWEAQRSGIKEKIKTLAKDGKPNTAQKGQLHDLDRDKPTPPRIPKLTRVDVTPEKLLELMAKHWPSGGIISSEAGMVFGSHGMGSESAMRNLATLNMLWEGGTVQIDRKTSESFTVEGARLTMGLQVQETTIRAFFANTKGLARGTGFLARFLVSWPESTQGFRPFTEAPPNWPALAAFNNRLTGILNRPALIDDNGALTPMMLTLSPEAKDVWVNFHNAIETMLAPGGDLQDVKDVASKTADNAARLAALFHTFTGNIGLIDAQAMESGTELAAWHLNESQRFLGELATPAELANPARLETWMLAYCKRENTDRVPTREIARCGPGDLRDKAASMAAITGLMELGRARLVFDGKKKMVLVRPEVLAGTAL